MELKGHSYKKMNRKKNQTDIIVKKKKENAKTNKPFIDGTK